jgi:Rieske Fe-S protein
MRLLRLGPCHGSEKRILLACSQMKETGLCDSASHVIEERVLSGIEEHLGDPSSWLNMSENTVARCAN